MAIPELISRLASYRRRNGIGATVRRTALELRRTLFSNRMVLFYCDLSAQGPSAVDFPDGLKVERARRAAEVGAEDMDAVIRSWNSNLARRMMEERFRQGASLWLIKAGSQLAGYGWTLRGRTIEPHYFRLAPEDAHLFDFYVFPEHRGRGLNPLLVTEILGELAAECAGRAFIEAAEWNYAQLNSLSKTPFHRLSRARKFTAFGRTLVCWGECDSRPAQISGKAEPFAASRRYHIRQGKI